MMGSQDSQKQLFSYTVNLDKRIRADNPLRQVQEQIDFSFVRQEVKEFYGYDGNESVDPEVLMKMMFLLFFDDVSSERELMRIIAERLDYMWFPGYGLDDEIPNHSVLSKARRRWGVEVFETLFVRIVAQCVQTGLVEGRKLHMDSSMVDANASCDAVLKGSPELIAQLREQLQSQMSKLDDPDRKPDLPSKPRRNRDLASSTDPDAPLMGRGPGSKSRPRYKAHRAVDNAHGVITAVDTTTGDVDGGSRLMTLVEQHEWLTGHAVQTVVADSHYGTIANFRACTQRGIEPHMAERNEAMYNRPSSVGLFSKEEFIYHPETDTYTCPAGKTMTRRPHLGVKQACAYTAKQAGCKNCAVRPKCHRNKNNPVRVIYRYPDQEQLDAAREQSRSRRARRDLIRRQWLMEGSFADAANNHGFKKARWRRLWRQQIQDYLIAAVQNIRKLLRRANKTGRPAVEAVVEIHRRLHAALNPLEASTLIGNDWISGQVERRTMGRQTTWNVAWVGF